MAIVKLKGFDKNYTVSETYKKGIGVDYHRGKAKAYANKIEAFEGVPLTPEWLERAGFEKTSSGNWKHPGQEYFIYEINAKNEVCVCHKYATDFSVITVLNSVHSLQNFFFALENKELEFNLDNLN